MHPHLHSPHRLIGRLGGSSLALLALLLPAPLAAQFEQPRPPGDLATTQTPEREEVRTRAEEAGLRLGPARFDPYLTLSNFVYTDNVFDSGTEEEEISDLRGGLNGGFNTYLPIGSKIVISGFAGANYVWWRDQDRLRDLRASYGATLFGLFNRMTLETGAGRVERQQDLSLELRAPVNVRDDRAFLRLRVEVGGAWRLVGSAETQRLRYGRELEEVVSDARLAALERDTDRTALGLEYLLSNGLAVGLGIEYSEQQFLNDPFGRSNESVGPLATLSYLGDRLTLDLVANFRTFEFPGSVGREEQDETIGRGRVGWKVGSRTSLTLYGARRLYASVLNENSFSTNGELGVAVTQELHRRLSARFFAERHSDEYREVETRAFLSEDVTEALGLTLQVDLGRKVRLELGAILGDRNSTDDDRDRSTLSIVASAGFGQDLLPW